MNRFFPHRIMSHHNHKLVNVFLTMLILSTFAVGGYFKRTFSGLHSCLFHASILRFWSQIIIPKKIQCTALLGCIFRMETGCRKSPIWPNRRIQMHEVDRNQWKKKFGLNYIHGKFGPWFNRSQHWFWRWINLQKSETRSESHAIETPKTWFGGIQWIVPIRCTYLHCSSWMEIEHAKWYGAKYQKWLFDDERMQCDWYGNLMEKQIQRTNRAIE